MEPTVLNPTISDLTPQERNELWTRFDGPIPQWAVADKLAQRPAPTELDRARQRRVDRTALSRLEREVLLDLDHAARLESDIDELEAELREEGLATSRLCMINLNLNSLRTSHRLCAGRIASDLLKITTERARLGMAPHVLTFVAARAAV